MADPIRLDPQTVFFGLAGTDAGHICIREPDGRIRRATPSERSLALLVCPRLRKVVGGAR